jgi:ABC-type branched-subunit amino acid transport system permease subunit
MWTSIFLRITGITVFIVTVVLGYFYSQSLTSTLQTASPGRYIDPGPTRFVGWYLPSAFALMFCALLFGVAILIDRKSTT